MHRGGAWHTLFVITVGLACATAFGVRPEKQGVVLLVILGFMAVASILIALGQFITYISYHQPCPKCGERRLFGAITRVPSGIQEDGSMHNPLVVTFDEQGNMYVRSYNRSCGSCGHRYYVDEHLWPSDARKGETKLVFTREQRDSIKHAHEDLSRYNTQHNTPQ